MRKWIWVFPWLLALVCNLTSLATWVRWVNPQPADMVTVSWYEPLTLFLLTTALAAFIVAMLLAHIPDSQNQVPEKK